VRVRGGVRGGVRVRVHVRGGVHVRVRVYKCRNAELSGIRSVRYQTEKTNDAGTGPVPDQAKAVQHFFGLIQDWNYQCRNADAGISFLDADAQLCS
jgi:hypothetical protein